MTVALYARYSSDNQREESITAQLRACREYCKKKGYKIVAEYTDEAESGRFDDRPGFQHMIKDAKAGRFRVIVMHKLDRNARNEYDYFLYKGQLQKAGVRIEYVEQSIDDTPEGQMMETMLVGMAAYYSRNLAREALKGMRENAYQAKWNGGTPPLGYDVGPDQRLVVNEKEAAVVRLIFSMRANGAGYTEMINALNAAGHKTKNGGSFGKNSLHDLLKNKKYIGVYSFGRVKGGRAPGARNSHKDDGDIIEIPNAIPAIIDEQTWNKVQEAFEKNKKGPGKYKAKEKYNLSGLIRCECGAPMAGSRVKTKGNYYRYYQCNAQQRTAGRCSNTRIKVEEIEGLVLQHIQNEILDPENLPKIVEKFNKMITSASESGAEEMKALEKEQAAVSRKINNLLTYIEEGEADDIIRQRYNDQRKRLADIKARIHYLTLSAKQILFARDQVAAVLHDFVSTKDKSPDHIRALFETFVDFVTVGAKEIFIKLKIEINNPDPDDQGGKKVLGLRGGGEPLHFKPKTTVLNWTITEARQ